jgi:PLP dependent protein
MSASVDDHRPAELVASLAAVRARLSDAASAAGREQWSVTPVAVTKGFPAADISILLGLGVFDFGESRDQEARAKLAQLHAGQPNDQTGSARSTPRLHFIGRLQTNKARAVARYADVVHTVDRIAIATGLAEGVQSAERAPLPVFVQVSLDGDPARGGISVAELSALTDHVASEPALRLLGLMAVAPQHEQPAAAYERLAELSLSVREIHPGATSMSAGMSGDFEVAVKLGATHVRIGSALLGRREVTFG